MKARRLAEVQQLVASPDFQAWWAEFGRERKTLAEAEASRDELLAQLNLMEFRAELSQKNAIDTLYRGGEHEDAAARLLAEAEALENKSFLRVAAFEEQRYKVSELWYRLGAAEKERDEAKESKRSQADEAQLVKKAAAQKEEYEREMGRKNRLWDEVEQLWMSGAESSLLTAEEKVLARKVRKAAEHLFGVAEERKKNALKLRADAETAAMAVDAARGRLEAAFSRARESFGVAVTHDFIYLRHRGDQKRAWAVALVDDAENYNLEVKALLVYSVDRQRGVAFLEPAHVGADSIEEGDRRFEEYFLNGRKGAPRATGA
jgi:hypothetical protein